MIQLAKRVMFEGIRFLDFNGQLDFLKSPIVEAVQKHTTIELPSEKLVPVKEGEPVGTNIAPPFEEYWMEWTNEKCSMGGYFRSVATTSYSNHNQELTILCAWKDTPPVVVGYVQYLVKPNGSLGKWTIYRPREMDAEEAAEDLEFSFQHFLKCHDLMACSNIALEDRPVDPAVERKLHRKLGGSGYTYKVLTIKQHGKRGESKPGIPLDSLPLHSVRGHIKTYTADKPLLGKVAGQFYWHPHVRGDSKNGVVDKDYKVEQ